MLATYPLELFHMDFLTIENPCTCVDMNILVITNHFTQYVKTVVNPPNLVGYLAGIAQLVEQLTVM